MPVQGEFGDGFRGSEPGFRHYGAAGGIFNPNTNCCSQHLTKPLPTQVAEVGAALETSSVDELKAAIPHQTKALTLVALLKEHPPRQVAGLGQGTVEDAMTAMVAKMGENLSLRRVRFLF